MRALLPLICSVAVLSVTAGGAREGVSADGAFTFVGECARMRGDSALSGITAVGDGTYWAADDNGRLVKGMVALDPASGAPRAWKRLERFSCAGVDDAEGVVFDPLDGTLWISDEKGPTIWQVDPRTRKVLGKVDVPPVYRRIVRNRGFEALALGVDGLTLWTANENPLSGELGSGCVRLQRFTRASVTDAWTASGQWAYRLTPGQNGLLRKSRNGLAELVMTEAGELLALEREKMHGFGVASQFRLRLFKVTIDDATDVSSMESLADASVTPVTKALAFDLPTGDAMYEAICRGPKLPNGSTSYVLVSDGDAGCDEKVMVLSRRESRRAGGDR